MIYAMSSRFTSMKEVIYANNTTYLIAKDDRYLLAF